MKTKYRTRIPANFLNKILPKEHSFTLYVEDIFWHVTVTKVLNWIENTMLIDTMVYGLWIYNIFCGKRIRFMNVYMTSVLLHYICLGMLFRPFLSYNFKTFGYFFFVEFFIFLREKCRRCNNVVELEKAAVDGL